MKVWLDDIRPAPPGWIRTKTVQETITYLALGEVTELSLDHDLGENEQTGYDLLCIIEKMVGEGTLSSAYGGAESSRRWDWSLPKFHVHSDNPVGRENMRRAIDSIVRLYNEQ